MCQRKKEKGTKMLTFVNIFTKGIGVFTTCHNVLRNGAL
jgi:hypothetical protein